MNEKPAPETAKPTGLRQDEEIEAINTQARESIRVVPSGLGALAKAINALDTLKSNQATIDAAINAARTFGSLRLNQSTLDAIARAGAIKIPRLNQSTLDAISNASKTFKSPNVYNSAADPPTRSAIAPDIPARGIVAENNSPTKVTIHSPADLGAMLRKARKAMGLSQQQFADLASVGRRFISECESGKPRLEFGKVLQVTAAAGITIFAERQ